MRRHHQLQHQIATSTNPSIRLLPFPFSGRRDDDSMQSPPTHVTPHHSQTGGGRVEGSINSLSLSTHRLTTTTTTTSTQQTTTPQSSCHSFPSTTRPKGKKGSPTAGGVAAHHRHRSQQQSVAVRLFPLLRGVSSTHPQHRWMGKKTRRRVSNRRDKLSTPPHDQSPKQETTSTTA